MADRKIRKKDCVRLSNKIIARCQLDVPAVTQITDIRSDLFIRLLEVLSHHLPPGIIANPTTLEDEVHNIQTIINHLALDLINVDLSHISGAKIISGNARAIYNLLEIFCGVHKYLSSHDIDRWNLEESLTETEEELSSSGSSPPSSEDSPRSSSLDQDELAAAAAAAAEEPEDPPETPSQRPAEALSGSLEGISTGTGASGASEAVSFPESQFSLDLELPISQSGDPRSANPPLSELSPAAASSSRETTGDTETAPETAAETAETAPETALETSEGPAESRESPESASVATPESPLSAPGGRAGLSSESTAPDSPTTETEETEETEQEPHRFQFADEQSPEDRQAGGDEYTNISFDVDSLQLESDEAAGSEAGSVQVGEQPEDISRELSVEMQRLREAEVAPVDRQKSVAADKKEHKKSSTTPGSSSDTAAVPPASRPPRPGHRSAPHPAAGAGADSRRRRSTDRSSASDPGCVGGRRACGRLLTRNIETIAEIHESGGERALTRTTREQTGDKLCRHTVHREIRRQVHSAPQSAQRITSLLHRPSSGCQSACSERVLRWLGSQTDDRSRKAEAGETDVFQFLRREFPYVSVSEETRRKLLLQYRQQMKYITSLVAPNTETRNYQLRRGDVLRRQALLTDIIRRQKRHDQRLRRVHSARLQNIRERNASRDAKIACLRAQRFVDSFKQQFESRAALNKSREELLMKAVFEEMLEIQRHRLRSVRSLEKRAIRDFYGDHGYTAELNRMHQFYEANFRDLAQMLSREKDDLLISQKEQTKLADRIKREFRAYMEADVRSLNDKLVTSWQPQYRELDADRIRSDLYQANWRFCVT